LDQMRLDTAREETWGMALEGSRSGERVRIDAGFVVDATGPRGFLQNVLGLDDVRPHWLPETEGLYTHFEGVERWDRLFSSTEAPPYPIDDAAVHHVFPGGWMWVLRFNNGLTSAGAALTRGAAASIAAAEGAPAWSRLLRMLPSVQEQFADARATLPFVHAPRLAFRTSRASGRFWALLPSAAGVIDPLLSTGF